ncbi:MAG: hypothetical protein U0V75_00025 [Ferruginibacter sp.]
MKKGKSETQLDLFSLGQKSENETSTKPTVAGSNSSPSNENEHSNGKVVQMKGHMEDIYERILNRTMS